MSWGDFLRREWGAATFVATVAIGLIVVPIALYLGKSTPAPVDVPLPSPPAAASTPSTASTPGPATSPR